MEIRFDKWNVHYKGYNIYDIMMMSEGKEIVLGNFLNESRENYNSLLRLNNKNDFTPNMIICIAQSIKEEFGSVEFKVSGDN